MATRHGLIVGAYFRPPAEEILKALPKDAELMLDPEPDNPFDPDAVKVLVNANCIPVKAHTKLREELPHCGWTLDRVLSQGILHIGYLARRGNKQLGSLLGVVDVSQILNIMAGESDWAVTLQFGPNGEYLARLEW